MKEAHIALCHDSLTFNDCSIADILVFSVRRFLKSCFEVFSRPCSLIIICSLPLILFKAVLAFPELVFTEAARTHNTKKVYGAG